MKTVLSLRTSALLLTAFLAVLTLWPQSAQAAMTEAWVHRFSNVVSNSVDRPLNVVNDAAGNIIVIGNSNDNLSGPDMLTIKYSGADGSMLWQQRHRYYPSMYALSYPREVTVAVAVDHSGNVVVTGSTPDTDNDNNSDYYTSKYAAATGEVLWETLDHGPDDDRPTAVSVDGSGNVVVTGSTATLKYAGADGALLWEKRSDVDHARALALDGNGNVVVTGMAYGYTSYTNYTAKYAANDGTLIWEQRNSNSSEGLYPAGVAVDGSGNVVVTGTVGALSGNADYYTAKYAAANGTLLWEKRYGLEIDDSGNSAHALAVDAGGNVVVTGSSYNAQGDLDYYTLKYAALDAALLWERRYDGPASNSLDIAKAVALDKSGNVVVTGISTTRELLQDWQPFDYCTVKYAAADGALLWESRYNSQVPFSPGSEFGLPAIAALTVDGAGNAIVTGPSTSKGAFPLPTQFDYSTAKYAGLNGGLLWEKSYNGPAHHASYPSEIVTDRNGNVVVTAISGNDYYVARYASADGALLWEKRGRGQVTHVVLDDSGGVLITGLSYDMGWGENKYYTAKYDANGALLWDRRGPGGGGQAALDVSGNVVVTGNISSNGGWNPSYYTAKYAASNGALLWEKIYSGPGNFDVAHAVAVDGLGNVAVTGSSATRVLSNRYHYYTAKYAASDGALLWEKRFDGSNDSEGAGLAVAMDRNGNVVVMGSNATLKYASSDGALLWVRYYTPTRALAVDDIGNVVVTGSPYTLKLAAADGSLLWRKSFVGTGTSVVVDGHGNVVVTGESYQNNTSLYTAKYAAADGSLLWEKRYNEGVAGGSRCLALGPNGLVAISGSFPGVTFGVDILTIVYRETLSALSLELISSGARLRFVGIEGHSYGIERSAAITGPWKTIFTQIAPASGLFEHLDTNAPGVAAFYRVSEP